ncbi:MAG: UDP-N-acetylglucosamine 4,6-dehydratase (inverting) [Acidimicrobiales bacterium]|nr:UDP-N-acetylglucosamine 4,6-dehydratase (inverting) [Acidimicrobiales bacterium]
MDSSPKLDLSGKTILLTGGTGSFGHAFTQRIIDEFPTATLRIFSRDELKQSEMATRFNSPQLRFFIGDIRNKQRLLRATQGADIVIHAAAMKQVPACEYNPFEAVQTNILGSQHVVDAAIDAGVERVVALSTDKAVNPVNLYGATKLCEEKIVVQGNAYASGSDTKLSCVRYGNVVGSRGSVVPVFKRIKEQGGALTVTDDRMTRFWLTLDSAVDLVFYALDNMRGGEVFVPRIPSMKVLDLAKAIAPELPIEIIGIRPGEKLHEVMITADEARHTLRVGDVFVVLPESAMWTKGVDWQGEGLPDGFEYSSGANDEWLTTDQLVEMLG